MCPRNIMNVLHNDFFVFQDEPFHTLQTLRHGVGMVENISGLKQFLAHTHSILRDRGILILNSMDVLHTDDPVHVTHHIKNLRVGL